jgi:hypothetical protein
MTLQTISLALNGVLLVALVVVVIRAKARIVEEKLATFAGALNAFTYGLAPVDSELRWERLSVGLGGLLGVGETQEIQWRLIRTSILHYLRKEPVAADLSEHLHALTLQCVRGEDEAERVWGYVDGKMANEPSYEQEPGDRFTGAELARAQFETEAGLYRMYATALSKRTHKLLG